MAVVIKNLTKMKKRLTKEEDAVILTLIKHIMPMKKIG